MISNMSAKMISAEKNDIKADINYTSKSRTVQTERQSCFCMGRFGGLTSKPGAGRQRPRRMQGQDPCSGSRDEVLWGGCRVTTPARMQGKTLPGGGALRSESRGETAGPRHFAAQRDESVIVGSYTFAKVSPVAISANK